MSPSTTAQGPRIVTSYDPSVNSSEELTETLSAVPPNDAWATYLWLDPPKTDGSDHDHQRLQHDFIHASILEMQRNLEEALSAFESLRIELKQRGYDGRILTYVDTAIKRLSVH